MKSHSSSGLQQENTQSENTVTLQEPIYKDLSNVKGLSTKTYLQGPI